MCICQPNPVFEHPTLPLIVSLTTFKISLEARTSQCAYELGSWLSEQIGPTLNPEKGSFSAEDSEWPMSYAPKNMISPPSSPKLLNHGLLKLLARYFVTVTERCLQYSNTPKIFHKHIYFTSLLPAFTFREFSLRHD